jgi:hypothetical protein
MASFRTTRAVVSMSGLLVSLVPGAATATSLFGVDFGTTQQAVLYDVDPATGAATNPRPTGLGHLVGVAYAPDGVLYGLTNSSAPSNPNSLVAIDPSTGASHLVGPTGLPSIVEGDLTRDPTTGLFYGCYNLNTGARQLFTINIQTGAATPLSGSLSGDPSALAFSPDGTLYGIDTSLGQLLTVNKATGAALSSKSLNIALGSTSGMAVDPATGVFYVADGESAGTDKLYTLNPATGVLTAIGPTGLANGLAGLTFVPEPEAAMLLGLAAMFAFVRKRSGWRVSS